MPPTPESVKVTILLAGGHQQTLYLPADSPVLKNLFTALVSQSTSESNSILFQIPIQEGRASLCFTGDCLVGVVTEPPLYVQTSPTASSPALASTKPSNPPPPDSPQRPTPDTSDILPSKYLHIDQFLPPQDVQCLLEFVREKEAEFVPTSTSTGAENYRQSFVLYHFEEFRDLLTKRIEEKLPRVLEILELPPFSVTQIEAQLTAHNDGNFYKLHNDSGSKDTANRELTYVYYFYQEPKPFTGGELRIYDSRIRNNYYVQAETFHTVEPRHNSIVFFLSRYMHEVLPVSCPSKGFADSRFTINGWIRR
ncbi:MAG: proline hydroxylase [Coleofasciculaceae cyanobacterium SM2_3_26]|nr:proline hydroxylase [Coleofasciculaceae cyanobacterium SM2_3_26]